MPGQRREGGREPGLGAPGALAESRAWMPQGRWSRTAVREPRERWPRALWVGRWLLMQPPYPCFAYVVHIMYAKLPREHGPGAIMGRVVASYATTLPLFCIRGTHNVCRLPRERGLGGRARQSRDPPAVGTPRTGSTAKGRARHPGARADPRACSRGVARFPRQSKQGPDGSSPRRRPAPVSHAFHP